MATGETSIFFSPIPTKVTPSDLTPSTITNKDSPEEALEKFKLWCESDVKDEVVNIQFERLIQYGNEETVLQGLEFLMEHRHEIFCSRVEQLAEESEL